MNRFSKFIIALSLILVLSVGGTVVLYETRILEDNAISYEKAETRIDSYSTIFLPRGKKLTILQLTDPQVKYPINNYDKFGGENSNDKTILMTRRMVDTIKPDLVVFTGDLVMSQIVNNWPYLQDFADLMEELSVYWTMSFGNHDSEGPYVFQHTTEDSIFGQESKEILIDKLKQYPHCLISKGDAKEEGGIGNHFINIRDKSTGDIIYTLCVMDCVFRPYSVDEEYHREKTPAQVAWYERHVNQISDMQYGVARNDDQVVSSLIFAHVPVPEIFDAYESAFNNGNPTSDYHYGHILEGNPSGQYLTCTLFEKALELQSTKAMFFGHYHDNDCNVSLNGINLVFGQHSGLSHYYRINMSDNEIGGTNYDMTDIFEYGDERGGTLITIQNDGQDYPFSIEQKLAANTISWNDISIDYPSLYLSLLEESKSQVTGNPQ